MIARIITDIMMIAGGAVMAMGAHPRQDWGEFSIGVVLALSGMVFRRMAEK